MMKKYKIVFLVIVFISLCLLHGVVCDGTREITDAATFI